MSTNYLSSNVEKNMSGLFWYNIFLLAIHPSAGGSLKAAEQDAACHSAENTYCKYQKAGNAATFKHHQKPAQKGRKMFHLLEFS